MDTVTLGQTLERYEARLAETRPQEVYKWKATKHFLDTFDLNASNLGKNIEEALGEARQPAHWRFMVPQGDA